MKKTEKNIKNEKTEKEDRLEEFNSLNIPEKFTFWEKILKTNYLQFLQKGFLPIEKIEELSPFRIIPIKKQDILLYNTALLNLFVKEMNPEKRQKGFLELDNIKNGFKNRLEKTKKNREDFISDELKKIDEKLTLVNQLIKKNNDQFQIWFLEAYHENYYNDNQFDISEKIYGISELLAKSNGNITAEYRKFLNVELIKEKGAPKILQKSRTLSIEKQLLILHFLGILEKIKHIANTKKAKFVSLLIGKNYQDVRAGLGNLYTWINPHDEDDKEQTIKYYKELITLFEEVGLTDISKSLSIKIQNLSK